MGANIRIFAISAKQLMIKKHLAIEIADSRLRNRQRKFSILLVILAYFR